MTKVSVVLLLAVLAFSACKNESFKKGEEGMEYKIISDGKGEKIQYGNFMQIHIGQFYDNGKTDSVITDTRNTAPMIEMLDSLSTPPAYFKILSQLRVGDSLVIRILSDSAFRKSPESMPPFIKKGHYLFTTVKVKNIFKTKEQADSARQAEMLLADERAKVNEAAQIQKDDKVLTDYFAKNNIKAVKAPLGTYVQIIQPGTGPTIDTSVIVKTNYTGRNLGGKTFDSNTDPAFNHVQSFNVNMTNDPSLGGPVMKGWYDGLKMLNKGAKAKFFIPSSLAYGAQGAGPDILPNAILEFDIEVLDLLTRQQAISELEKQRKEMMAMQKRYTDSMAKLQPDTSGRK